MMLKILSNQKYGCCKIGGALMLLSDEDEDADDGCGRERAEDMIAA